MSGATTHRALLCATFAAIAVTVGAFGQQPPVNQDRRGLALQGYDAVAYAREGRPVKGQPAYSYRWNDSTWHFASAEHRDAFVREPERYAPQFGGYCAYAVSRNYTADVDPEAWSIVDGRLYLNYSKRVQRLWEQERDANIEKARGNWPGVLKR
jgi:YHS domain-containing protein